ncbi:MAG: c-type cytochrome [Planctomycetota bacterium]
MFVTRLVAATAGTIVLVAVVFFATEPPPRDATETATASWGAGPPRPVSAPALFREHCASCHGEDGNGDGTTELERPARSFMAGGYAYGNTLQDVMRTLRHGIPGTAMPAFGESLTDQQRSSLARHVIAMGPEGTDVREGSSRLDVAELPVAVQGLVVTDGEQLEPRSLVIGFPGGTTLHYRSNDLRLLALLEGDFVDRADWRGRGGEALRLLGRALWTSDDTTSAPFFVRAGDESPLRPRRSRTSARSNEVVVAFELVDEANESVGRGEERIAVVDVDGADVAVRMQRIVEGGDAIDLTPLGNSQRAGSFRVDRAASLTQAVPTWRDDVRVIVHTSRWTDALGDAIEASLQRVP